MKTPRRIHEIVPAEKLIAKANDLMRHAKRNTATGCLECTCAIHKKGYGWVGVSGKQFTAHRVVWTATVGPVPDDKWLLHSCDNRRCINIDHLHCGSPSQNNQECVERGRWRWGKLAGKLNPQRVREIRIARNKGITQRDAAKAFGVSQSMISHIATGKQWGFVQ